MTGFTFTKPTNQNYAETGAALKCAILVSVKGDDRAGQVYAHELTFDSDDRDFNSKMQVDNHGNNEIYMTRQVDLPSDLLTHSSKDMKLTDDSEKVQ